MVLANSRPLGVRLMQKSKQKKSRLRLPRTKNYACRRKKSELAPPTSVLKQQIFFYRPLHLFFGSPADARGKTNRPRKNESYSKFEFFSRPYLPQHFLYFFPLPQGQGSLRPIPFKGFIWGFCGSNSKSL